jgi:hypothetical protein
MFTSLVYAVLNVTMTIVCPRFNDPWPATPKAAVVRVSEFLATDPAVLSWIPGATRISEKYWGFLTRSPQLREDN